MPIIYSKTKNEFIDDVFNSTIVDSLVRETGPMFPESQMRAIRNSMKYMSDVMRASEIPNNAGVAIEYKIPASSRRIDFIITGKNINQNPVAILVELKQWDKAEITEMDGVVRTYVGHAKREVEHPSYQVWSYATFIKDFNENIEEKNIVLEPCAYLHNYKKDNVIENDFYKFYTEQAPFFIALMRKNYKILLKTLLNTETTKKHCI